MRLLNTISAVALAACCSTAAAAQTAGNLTALQAMAPFSTLLGTPAGKAALAANYKATGAIQAGTANQRLLLPFPQQQQQALRDAFITWGNGDGVADGLGSTLGGAYLALTTYTSTDDGKTAEFTSLSPAVADIIRYTYKLANSDAGAGKYFFSNETTDGKTPVSAAAMALMTAVHGTPDVFGKAYNHPASSPGADPYGDSRPFQTEPKTLAFSGTDYFGQTRSNMDYLSGPVQALQKSPAWPSGHTTYGYTESLLLAELVPQRFTQMVTRGAEYGNDRIILGAHYAMDVISGRTLASYDLAHLLANNASYLNQAKFSKTPIADYPAALQAAKADLTAKLQSQCGGSIPTCAGNDHSRFKDAAANQRFYESTQTYGLPVVYPATANTTEDVATKAPEAGTLLTTAFPSLTLKQADDILTATEGPGGGFLDNGSSFGLYSRLDLYRAGVEAAKAAAK